MSTHSLRELREAKTIGPHLEAILKVIMLSEKSLSHFKSYLPVVKILNVLAEQKTLLELHKKKYDAILKSKGQI